MWNRSRLTLFICISAAALTASLSRGAAQSASAPASRGIVVSGAGLTKVQLSLSDVAGMTRTTVRVKDHDAEAVFEGVLVSQMLKRAGFTFGQHFRGPRMADYLIAEAADGYRVVFALPELDAEFSNRVVIVADRCDGKPLSERDGPLKIIVSDEKKHARWVRNVVSLTVATAAK